MPYNPSTQIYTLPAVYLAIPGTTILAVQHNDPLTDLETAQNYARPVIAGGTGANNPTSARVELDVAGLIDINRFTATQEWATGASVASAATPALGTDGNSYTITGTTTITALPTFPAGTRIQLIFAGILTLTHSAALRLIGSVNIQTGALDIAEFLSAGSGNWYMTDFIRTAGAFVPVSTAPAPTVAGALFYDSTLDRLVGGNGATTDIWGQLTPWVTYTPTFSAGFGTVTLPSIWSRRNGDSLEIQGTFVTGTVAASVATMTLGFNGTNANVTINSTKVATLRHCGTAVRSSAAAVSIYTIADTGGPGLINFGIQNASFGGLTKANGDSLSGNTITFSITASVPITGW